VSFIEKVTAQAAISNSIICVGLDPDTTLMPSHVAKQPHAIYEFNSAIIGSTSDDVCAYKLNSAFFEAYGSRGIAALTQSRAAIPSQIPVIFDIKRGDISHSAMKYAEYAYDVVDADAVTVNPYMGFDAVKPFIRNDKCVFVLCLTSNASADEFELMETKNGPLYLEVARAAKRWANEGEIGLVVGATRPDTIARIREAAGDLPFLVPGVGAQGGDVDAVVKASGSSAKNTIIASSRQVLYASNGRDFAAAASHVLSELRDTVNQSRV
jgi:orotidine-5'-phosphate decarboxylase